MSMSSVLYVADAACTLYIFNCGNCFKEFCETLFLLFDHRQEGRLVQDAWFSHIRNCSLIPGWDLYTLSTQYKYLNPLFRLEKEQNELVEVIETVTYQICRDDDINVDIFYEVRSTDLIWANEL